MGKRGLTFAEKRNKMLGVFHNTQEAYNLKEIEKFSIKLGLPLPTVKEILDSLVGDDLVIQEKIGAGNYYWSFPSQAYQSLATRNEKYQQENKELDAEIEDLETRAASALQGKEDTKERKDLNTEISALTKEHELLDNELKVFQRNDPKRLNEMSSIALTVEVAIKSIKERANNVTDEIFQARKWITDKFNMSKADFAKNFSVPEEIDYIE